MTLIIEGYTLIFFYFFLLFYFCFIFANTTLRTFVVRKNVVNFLLSSNGFILLLKLLGFFLL